MRNLRKTQKIVLVIGLIIVFYVLIYPRTGYWDSGAGMYVGIRNDWIWEVHGDYGRSIFYKMMLVKIFIVSIGTVMALLIEGLYFLRKKMKDKME